jgi:putative transposase
MISTPDRHQAVTLIAAARTEGARLEPACAVVGITVHTHQRWTREGGVREDQRPLADRATPANALSAEETQARPDRGAPAGPGSAVPRVGLDLLPGVAPPRRVTHRGRAKTPKRQARPTTYHAGAPNRLWSWDCTWLPGPVKGTYYYLVMIIDIFSRKVVGWEVFLGESADNARGVLERAVLAEHVVQQPLVLHADNGSAFKAATLLEKLRDMNIEPSFSRPRVSNDNPYSEALFRTCKYVPTYPVNGFAALPAARDWVQAFVRWYNHEHRHSGIRFVTPAERHAGHDTAILNRRHALNEQARSRNPSRWSGNTRNWEPVHTVALNPDRELVVHQAAPERLAA